MRTIIVPTTQYSLFQWSGISPITNKLEYHTSPPSVEQAFWVNFKIEESHGYDIIVEKWDADYWDKDGKEFRVLWTDQDDSMCHAFFATIEESMQCFNDFADLKYRDVIYEMFELYGFEFW